MLTLVRPVDVDVLAVLPPPHDHRLRVADGAAGEGHVGPLLGMDVTRRFAVDDVWWNCKKERGL